MFQKTSEVPVKEVQKICPRCKSQMITANMNLCDSCSVAVASSNNTCDNKDGENTDALQDS